MLKLVKLIETTYHGCMEDDSAYTETETSYHVFNDEEKLCDWETGYFENQDYSYSVSFVDVLTCDEGDLPEIIKSLFMWLFRPQ